MANRCILLLPVCLWFVVIIIVVCLFVYFESEIADLVVLTMIFVSFKAHTE